MRPQDQRETRVYPGAELSVSDQRWLKTRARLQRWLETGAVEPFPVALQNFEDRFDDEDWIRDSHPGLSRPLTQSLTHSAQANPWRMTSGD